MYYISATVVLHAARSEGVWECGGILINKGVVLFWV